MSKKYLTVYNLAREKEWVLKNAFDVIETKENNSVWELEFSIPKNEDDMKHCQPYWYVRYGDNGQMYRFTEQTKTNANESTVTYHCEHVIATLSDDVMFQGPYIIGNKGVYTDQVINFILDKQTVKNWVLGTCQPRRQFEYSWENENLLAALFSVPNCFATPYMWTYDTSSYPWKLNLVEINEDADPDFYLMAKKNILQSSESSSNLEICTRLYGLGEGEGVNQLTIKSVNNGLPYIQSSPEKIAEYGIVSRIFVDRRYQYPEMLKARMETLLHELETPSMKREFDIVDLYDMSPDDMYKAEVGKICLLKDDNTKVYITKTVKNWTVPGDMKITIATKATDISTSIADLADRQRIEQVYSQGASQVYSFNFSGNATDQYPLNGYVYFPEDLKYLNEVKLKVMIDPFRSYSKAAILNGGFTKQVSTEASKEQTTTSEASKEQKTTSEESKEQTTTSEESKEQTTTSEESKEQTTTSEESKEQTTTSEASKEQKTTSEESKEQTTTSEASKEQKTTSEASKEQKTTSEESKEQTTTTEESKDYDIKLENKSTTTTQISKSSTTSEGGSADGTTNSTTGGGSINVTISGQVQNTGQADWSGGRMTSKTRVGDNGALKADANGGGTHTHNINGSTGEVTPPASLDYKHSHAMNFDTDYGGAHSHTVYESIWSDGHSHSIDTNDLQHKHSVAINVSSNTEGQSGFEHSHSFKVASHTHEVDISHTHEISLDHTHDLTIPAHSHKVTIPAHSHKVTIPEHSHKVTIPEHSHKVTIPEHSHKVTIPAHSHKVTIPEHSHKVTIPTHDHKVTIPAHNHKVTIPAHNHKVTIPAHDHKVTIPAHDHTLTVDPHSHDIEPGIFESGKPTQAKVYIDNVYKFSVTDTNSEVDITDYLKKNGKVPRGQWIQISIQPSNAAPNNMAFISAFGNVFAFIQSYTGGNY